MDRSFNCNGSEGDKDYKASEGVKKAFDESMWRQRVEKYRKKSFKQLGSRHQHVIENYIASQLGYHRDDCEDLLVNEIKNGKISFAYEGMSKFPRSLVEVLRHDITHLDLTANNIRSFEFLRGFKSLKSLIVDENIHMDMESFPPVESLELFYANKCNIEFPRSFVFRVSVIFPSLKYFSMMSNPAMKLSSLQHIWEGKEHRQRMFAVFMNLNLIHFNEKKITDEERQHSNDYHKYLGPIDCKLSKFRTLPDTDDIRKILPVHIRDKTIELISMELQDEDNDLDEALTAVSISAYFTTHQNDNISIKSYASSDSSPTSVNTITTDEGLGSMAPSEHFFD